MNTICKKTTLIIACLFLAFGAVGQYAIAPEIRSQVAVRELSQGMAGNPANIVYGFAAPPGRVVGDVYIDTEWHLGNILLESGTLLENYRVRYDLMSQTLEIQTTSAVRLLDFKLIKTLVWRDDITTRYFISGSAFSLDGSNVVGLIEVLSDGKKPLFRHTKMYMRQPDYVPAFDVGSRDAKIYKKSKLYVADGNELQEVKGKKDIIQVLGDKKSEMETFIETNDLRTKTDFEVARIFDYYNSLFEDSSQSRK